MNICLQVVADRPQHPPAEPVLQLLVAGGARAPMLRMRATDPLQARESRVLNRIVFEVCKTKTCSILKPWP